MGLQLTHSSHALKQQLSLGPTMIKPDDTDLQTSSFLLAGRTEEHIKPDPEQRPSVGEGRLLVK